MAYIPIEPQLGNLPVWPTVSSSGDAMGFPYVSTFPDFGGGSNNSVGYRGVSRANFQYYDGGVDRPVQIGSGEVYCGLGRMITVPGGLSLNEGSVFLNIDNLEASVPSGHLSLSVGGQVTLLLYEISYNHISDYRDRLILPLYS